MAEFIRQQNIINQRKLSELHIAVIGAGSIGSFTALALTKMGCQHLALWDHDNVELHNVSNQFFNKESLGEPKTIAVAKECKRFTPTEVDIETFNEFYHGQSLDRYDIVIALTDNIEGRKDAFEAAKKSANTKLFIDSRMGGEIVRVLSLNIKDEKLCEKYFTDYIEGVVNEELPCTERTIIYNVLLPASIITSYVKKFVNGEEIPFEYIFCFKDYSQVKSKTGGVSIQ